MEEPIEWAKDVAWSLARLQSETTMIRALLVELVSRQTGLSADAIKAHWKEHLDKKQEEIYREILERCGLPCHLPDEGPARPK
jgi:hypothetical protein